MSKYTENSLITLSLAVFTLSELPQRETLELGPSMVADLRVRDCASLRLL